MKILLLTPSAPSPQDFEGCPRHFSFAKELKKRGHDIYLLTQGEVPERFNEEYQSVFSDIFHLGKTPTKAESLPLRVFHTLSFSSSLDYQYRFPMFLASSINKTRTLIERISPDVIMAKTIDVEQFIPPDFKPCLIDLVDSIALLSKRISDKSSDRKSKIENYRKYIETLKLEKRVLKRREHCMTISEIDSEFLESKASIKPKYTLPNGVNEKGLIEEEKLIKLHAKREPSIVFSGAMSYFPNKQAALYLGNSIFPKVRESIPGAKLHLVGKSGKEELSSLEGKENIEVTGFVDSISPYLEKGGVYASPLLSGAGLKNKILSAFSSGIPVVASELSADGINVSEGCELLLAKSADEFAEKICLLLNSKERALRLSKSALTLVKEEYRWEKISIELEEILKNISSSSTSTS